MDGDRLEDSLPDSPFASSTNHLLLFAESADSNGSDLLSPSSDNDDNSTPSPLSDPSNSVSCQMPRFQDSTTVYVFCYQVNGNLTLL